MRAVKCDCLVLSLGHRSTIYCLDSSPQFCRICLVIQRLHFCLLCSFVVLVISSFISGRAGEVGSRALNFSNISVATSSVLIRCSPEGMWCDAALRIMARTIFSSFLAVRLSLSSISLLYRSQSALFRLMLVRCCIGVIVTSICKLMRIGRWSEPRFVFVCQ